MTMIRVQYFALFREQAGRAHEEIESEAATTGELFKVVAQRHALARGLERAKVAVNDEMADWSTPVADGDTVLFFPPVSGG